MGLTRSGEEPMKEQGCTFQAARKGTHRHQGGVDYQPKKNNAKKKPKRNPKETERNGSLLVLLSSLVQCGIQCGSNTRW